MMKELEVTVWKEAYALPDGNGADDRFDTYGVLSWKNVCGSVLRIFWIILGMTYRHAFAQRQGKSIQI